MMAGNNKSHEDENKLRRNLPLFGAFSWIVVNTLTATNQTNILVFKTNGNFNQNFIKVIMAYPLNQQNS